MGLADRIWATRLGFGSRDWDLGLETGGGRTDGRRRRRRRRRRKFPICVKAMVIDPFGATAQKGDQPTNRPTDRWTDIAEQQKNRKR